MGLTAVLLLGILSSAVLLLGILSVLPAAAENKYSSLLVLGDSISTGYGLENYTPGGTPYLCRS